jgi:hypothetical protein
MPISRRKFVQISSLAPLAYAMPFRKSLFDITNGSTLATGDTYKIFSEPPAAAHPFVRWWWSGGRITEKEILRELDMLKAKGISGVEINTIAFPENNLPMGYQAHDWLGAEWMKMLKITVDGAKQRGITCDIIVGSGWPFGGESLNKDEQIQLLALGTKTLTGPKQYQIKKAELLSDMDALMTYKKGYMELTSLRLAPDKMDKFTAGTDLNSQVGKDEILVDVPEGAHTFYYTVKLTGYTAVTHGAPGASGPVLNHYSKPAVQKFLNRMSDAINSQIGPMGNYFRSVFVDSLELRGSNWCDDLFTEFKRRRGYDLEPYLPFVLFKINRKSTYNGGQELADNPGFSAQTTDELERVRYDFETTRLELFDERFLKTFIEWCKTNKVKSRVQAYGREYYPLESAMQLDIPECETWIHADVGGEMPENTFKTGRMYRPVNKFVSSAARLTGKHIISCEEITNTAMVFNATLERIKITGDQSNLSGVTHSILHGFNYSPPEVPFPGWVRYGTFFNERNTWWPYLKNWIDYKARLSAVFQAGELQSDVAVMFPEADMWSKVGLQYQQFPQIVVPEYANNIWEAIHQNGGGCDYINEGILQKSTFSAGALHYGPRSYKTLLLASIESIAPETAEALKKFAAAGGQVVFIEKEPVKSYGQKGHQAKDAQVAAAVQSLKTTYPKNVGQFPAPGAKIIDWYAQMQTKFNIASFVKMDNPVNHVSQNYYKTPDADIFFISNYSIDKSHGFTATFNIKNRTAWVWNAETGKKYLYPTDGAKNRLKIDLDPAESILIAFTDETKGEIYPVRKMDNNVSALTLDGPWDVTLEKVYEPSKKMEFKSLIDFKDDAELKSFAGVIYYEKTFNVTDANKHQYLNLGNVAGISEVTLNGSPLGYKWYGRHIYNTQKLLKPGANTIKIKVTTVMGNYAKSLKDNVIAQQWTKTQPLYPMGLIGPVSLV